MRWLLLITFALAGCPDQQAARLEKIKDAVCTCKTSSCAELAMKDVPQGNIKPTAKAQGLARDMMACLARLYDAERPTTDPADTTGP